MILCSGIGIDFVLKNIIMAINNDKNRLRVLVIDDNLFNRKLACAILTDHNIEYDIAENGKVAVDFYEQNHYDLILMDIQMPIMNGIECAEIIRKKEMENNTYTPIIAVTAFATESDEQTCMDAGMDAFITKPYKAPDLVKEMNKYIDFKPNY